VKFPLIYVVVGSLTSAGCGGSSNLAQPSAVAATPSGNATPSSLMVDGRKGLSAIGETSQLTALARWRDGVLEPVSGKSAVTDQAGIYTLAGLASRHLRFQKDGYESGELDAPPDEGGYMRMQRIVRIAAGVRRLFPLVGALRLFHQARARDLAAHTFQSLIVASAIATVARSSHRVFRRPRSRDTILQTCGVAR